MQLFPLGSCFAGIMKRIFSYSVKKHGRQAMADNIKKTIIKGTFILTIAGILTKLLGFYNRVFLATTIGAKEIGIYQLIFPVYLIVHCLSCQGFEMGIMKFVAEEASFGNKRNVWRYLKLSFLFSFSISIFLMIMVLCFHEEIAIHLLKQAACSKSLFILAFAFPIISIKDCILSYYFAMKKTELPACAQLLEQCVRVTVIWALATFVLFISKDASLATIGLVAGEGSALLLTLFAFPKMKKNIDTMVPCSTHPYSGSCKKDVLPVPVVIRRLSGYCIPIIGTRLLMNLLSSAESVLIPYTLAKTLGNEDTALSLYGTLTGMAMTFILFPSAITNSVAMMLLPTISEAKARSEKLKVTKAASLSLHYCLLLGILCTALFLTFGKSLGLTLFHDRTAGEFIFILAWLCPFIYISTTYTSILNGLGRTGITFSNNIITALIRIFAIVALVPYFSIFGYLLGLLVSYLILALLSIYHVHRETQIHFSAKRSILSPACLALLGVTFAMITEFLLLKAGLSIGVVTLGISCLVLAGIYCVGCVILRIER